MGPAVLSLGVFPTELKSASTQSPAHRCLQRVYFCITPNWKRPHHPHVPPRGVESGLRHDHRVEYYAARKRGGTPTHSIVHGDPKCFHLWDILEKARRQRQRQMSGLPGLEVWGGRGWPHHTWEMFVEGDRGGAYGTSRICQEQQKCSRTAVNFALCKSTFI